ncbi:phage tail protein, partial [Salmonella enterica]|nr:phage tail protein [Salmonella enterica]EJC0938811.1 phage tail protein [Salmonella enterica]EKP1950279.1 phage tail protein [Salmonella enterica]EKP2038771.1 phage tail protein [Salmonella enterica]
PRYQVDDIYIGAHSHAVPLGPNSHGNHLNTEYLSGVKK